MKNQFKSSTVFPLENHFCRCKCNSAKEIIDSHARIKRGLQRMGQITWNANRTMWKIARFGATILSNNRSNRTRKNQRKIENWWKRKEKQSICYRFQESTRDFLINEAVFDENVRLPDPLTGSKYEENDDHSKLRLILDELETATDNKVRLVLSVSRNWIIFVGGKLKISSFKNYTITICVLYTIFYLFTFRNVCVKFGKSFEH